MELLTPELREKLTAATPDAEENKPWLKLFDPTGAATWLLSEYDPKRREFFGLCDLGMGCPELGYVSLDELKSIKRPLGLGIERDIHWTPVHTLNHYAKMAREAGHIIT